MIESLLTGAVCLVLGHLAGVRDASRDAAKKIERLRQEVAMSENQCACCRRPLPEDRVEALRGGVIYVGPSRRALVWWGDEETR